MKLLNRLFIALTVAGLATMLVPVSAQADGMTFDDKGNLFVADDHSHSIFKFTPDGKKSTFASGLSGLAFDHSGNLFVSNSIKNSDNFSIFKFTPDGVKSTFASGLSDPVGLACDGAGNLFVSDIVVSSNFKFTPDGTQSTFASGLRFPRD